MESRGRQSTRRRRLAALCVVPLIVLGLWSAGARAGQEKFVFVTDGKPTAAVVTPPKKDDLVADYAARELIDFVKQCTGAILPRIEEGQSPPQDVERMIYIGETNAARAAGIDPDKLKNDHARISASGEKLILSGKDWIPKEHAPKGGAGLRAMDMPRGAASRGSYYAVIHLIEHDLGGAFLWPGKLGTVYPKDKTMSAAVKDWSYTPPFLKRRLRNVTRIGIKSHKYEKMLGYTQQQSDQRMIKATRWLNRRGQGSRLGLHTGHFHHRWWDKYGKEHPDWFAKQPTGVVGPVKDAKKRQLGMAVVVKLDVSNPAIVKPIMDYARSFFKRVPHSKTMPLGITDGRWDGFCMGKRCRSWDVKRERKHRLFWAKPDGSTYSKRYDYLTDRYARYWNRIAKAVHKKYPDKWMYVLAYGAVKEPPKKTPLPPHLVVNYVPNTQYLINHEIRRNAIARWDRWAAKPAHPMLVFRPNMHYVGRNLPLGYARRITRDIHHFRKHAMVGGDFDALHMDFGTEGLSHYVLARLMFNPDLAVDTIVDQYTRKAFGDGAGPMKKYFMLLERISEGNVDGGPWRWRRQQTSRLAAQADAVHRWFAAARTAAGEDSAQARRVDFFAQGFRYAMLMNQGRVAAKKHGPESEQFEQAYHEFNQFLKDHEHSWVIDLPFLGNRFRAKPEGERIKRFLRNLGGVRG